jgi:hypothetical protein
MLNRLPQSDVHCVAEHVTGTEGAKPQAVSASPGPDWASRRKARPAETLLAMTPCWMSKLPPECLPTATSKTFPRIANMLAMLWTRPDALKMYLDELLVDKRGSRRGFPGDVSSELQALAAYYATLHPERSAAWDEAKQLH